MRRLVGKAIGYLPEPLGARLRGSAYRYSPSDIPPPPVAPSTQTRLYIGPVNYAGQGYHWARAVERLPSTGAVSMQFRHDQDFGFPSDNAVPVRVFRFSRHWQRRQFEAVASGFTHVIVEAGKPLFGSLFDDDPAREIRELRRRGLSVAMLSHGSDLRQPHRHREIDQWSPFFDGTWDRMPGYSAQTARHRALLVEMEAPVFVSTPDLLLDWPEATWLPTVIEPARWKAAPPLQRTRLRVVHAPSNAYVKGSSLIDPIMRRLHDSGVIEYRRIEGVPAQEMPGIYRDADIVLEQFRIGTYSVAAIEAMAAGRVVIAHVHDQVRQVVRDRFGVELPIVQATADELEQAIVAIITERERFAGVAAQGPGFVQRVHNGAASAEALRPFLSKFH